MDSDYTPVHEPSHPEQGDPDSECRLCRVRGILAEEKRRLRPRTPYAALKTAAGMAVPQIEAWFRCGINHGVNEFVWRRAGGLRHYFYDSRGLKRAVYGTETPSGALAVKTATNEAKRLVDHGLLPQLEQSFPGGFGALAADVRSW